jgi:chaperone modulatory protein CbpM
MITITTICATVPGLTEADILHYVEAEWVRPARQAGQPIFSEADLARIRLIQDLRTALEVEEPTLPLVLSLLDQLYATRRQLRLLLESAPPELRAQLAAGFGG